jgi:hypothetical protein
MKRVLLMKTQAFAPLHLLPAVVAVGLITACTGDRSHAQPPASAQPGPVGPVARPDVPKNLEPSPSESVAARASASGVQIYECKAEGWKLFGPDAQLIDQEGRPMGKHYAGPTWESVDGSKVTGEVRQKVDAPDGRGVPWLLLNAKSNNGAGTFGKVTSIQRVDTLGGKPPVDGCDASSIGKKESVPYRATYYFYSGIR